MRSFKLALGFMLMASVAMAQSYPSPTMQNLTVLGTATIPALPGLSTNVQGTGVPGLNNVPNGWMLYAAPSSASTNNPLNLLLAQRTPTYTGGTPGFVNSGIKAYCSPSSGVANYEWCGTFIMDNFATGGENVAIYAQSIKEVGAGPTWASTFELLDKTTANPVSSAVSVEIDIAGQGTDSNNNRSGINMFAKCQTALAVNCTSQTFTAAYGVSIRSDAKSSFKSAYHVSAAADVGFDCAAATLTSGCVKMSDGQPVIFSNTGDRSLYWLSSNLRYRVSGSDVLTVSDAGSLDVGGAVLDNLAWTSYASTVTAGSGTITTLGTVTAAYKKIGKTAFFRVKIPITTNGTGAVQINFTTPATLAADCVISGRETQASGKMLQGWASSGNNYFSVINYDNTYPGANNTTLVLSGSCEVS